MKTVIAGGRKFNDYEYLFKCLFSLKDEITEVISGCASGADTLGERWAIENNKLIIKMPADWNRYGKSAGAIRNKQMADIADFVIVFWDGESRGSAHMIETAEKMKLRLEIFKYKKLD